MGSGTVAKRIGGEFLMADYLVTDTELTSIANAIRTKGGTQAQLSFPTDFVSAINAISGGGGGLEYETGTFSPESDIARPEIIFKNSHTDPPVMVTIQDSTGTIYTTSSTVVEFTFAYFSKFSGTPLVASSSLSIYAILYQVNRGSNASQFSASGEMLSSESGSSGVSRYVSNTGFIPNRANNYYYRSGRTYKWLAVWKPTS